MELSLEAKEAIRGAVEDMVKQFPDILGIDEIIPGCQVFSLDPFGVGVGVFPRYLEVGLRGTAPAVGLGTGYRVHVLFRGGLTLAVGDYVTVVHMRDADRYEVLTAGGAAGTVSALPDHDHSAPGVGGANLREIEEFEFEDAALLTIDAGGAITRTRVYHRVDTFGGAASDDLVTINGGVEGDLLIIHSENVARTVVVKHGAGNIWLAGSVDYTFDDTRHHLTLLYNGASWSDISSIGSTAGGAPVDAQYLVLALNAALTAERRFDPMAWLGAVDGGVNADYDLSFYPDLPVVIGTGAIPLEYATIQAAINAAAAGQTVLVPPGTYAEDITLKDGVLVVGWGAREDIRITGDESIVTTASGGHLENVTVDADAPGAGAYRGAVLFNSAGICTFRGVRIEMTSNASVTGACGIHTIGANAGMLNAHDVEIAISTNQDNSMACGIRITGTYVLYLADFSIDAANTGIGSGGYGACAIALLTTGTGVVETRHGKITVSGASKYSYYNAGTAPLIYSVEHDDETIYGRVDYAEGDRHPYVNNRTVTVGAGKNFATIQAAVNWFKSVIVKGTCYIVADAGAYDEAVAFANISIAPGATLTLTGDTRVLAGITYVDSATMNRGSLANGGSGTCSLTIDGTRTIITVTGSTTSPDFDADGWVATDRILCFCDDGNTYERIISAALNNTITITVALPAGATLGNDGTAVALLPNRSVERTVAGPCISVGACRGIAIDGWYLQPTTGAGCDGLLVINNAFVAVANTLAQAEDTGFACYDGYSYTTAIDGACSAWGCAIGYYVAQASQVDVRYSVAVRCATGYYCYGMSWMYAYRAVASTCTTYDYRAVVSGAIYAVESIARLGNTGYYAAQQGYIYAATTNANNTAATPYNPTPTDTWGNNNGSITFS